ncbi:MAG: hypothetical protein IPL78_03720 [Chloroflexi bacterium]|nr:hypothetical protein [Chloroflexota bacterium]
MNQESLLNELIKIHTRFSFDRYRATATSQFCTMWSVDDPPDVLEGSEPLEAICDLIDMDIDEEYAVELYDMTLQEAAASLVQFINQPVDEA